MTKKPTTHQLIRKDLQKWLKSEIKLDAEKDFYTILSEKHDRSVKTVQNIACMVKSDLADKSQEATGGKIRRTVVISDLHIPYHHESAVSACLKLIGDIRPEHLVLNGDVLDCYSISSFDKDPRLAVLQEEIDLTKDFLHECRAALPYDAKISFIEGNHEERLSRLIAKNQGFFGLEALTWRNLLDLDHFHINFTPYKDHITVYNSIQVTHGHRISKHSAYSAKAHLVDGGYRNVLVGHTHRMGNYNKTGIHGTRRAYEIGGLFDRDKADYISHPNWQSGFAVIHKFPNRKPTVDLVEIDHDDGSFTYNDRVYSGKTEKGGS